MAIPSPLHTNHENAGALLAPYGPPIVRPDGTKAEVDVVQAFAELEVEYAAIRKLAAIIDQPQRAVLDIRGADRISFLNRMVTQELKGFAPGQMRKTFWLNRKGRVDGDLTLLELGDRVLADVDVHAAARCIAGLASYVISEEVMIADATAQYHRLGAHGPLALEMVSGAAEQAISSVEPGTFVAARIAGHEVLVARDDSTGEIGLELFVPTAGVVAVYAALLAKGDAPGVAPAGTSPHVADRRTLREIGWHAWNIARIEAGTPLYNIDFGEESLPAETGVLNERVSFKKGCYLGQEIVARMHARGHPKQLLVALLVESPANATPESLEPLVPPAGGAVMLGDGTPVGVVTSSTLAPMRGSAPVAFAQVKYDHANPRTVLTVQTHKGIANAFVQDGLRFLPKAAQATA